jgi:hypothetical protein
MAKKYLPTFEEFLFNSAIPLGEKLELKDYKDYSELVADAYDAAPDYDPSVVSHWKALNSSNYDWWKRLTSEAKIEFISGDSKYKGKDGSISVANSDYVIRYLEGGEPYATAKQMSNSFKNDGVLYISIDYSNHPVFSVADNIVFRTVHDYIVHIKGGFEFGLKGELGSYNLHAKIAPKAALPALFTEIVGQACYAVVRGKFPSIQKIAKLDGFDLTRVGYVEGYDVKDRTLTKR